jgi:hypothetical protein
MDYNRWNGDKSTVLNYVNQQEMIPVTCPLDNLPCTGNKMEPKKLSFQRTLRVRAPRRHKRVLVNESSTL